MSKIFIEICVDSPESALAAQEGGASGVELCTNLAVGGTTPSAGTIAETRKHLSIGLEVLIRPRAGDFCYTDAEFNVLRRDVLIAKELGANGIVCGLLRSDLSIDAGRMRSVVETARPLSVTFHRAFDLVPDPVQAMQEILDTGVNCILTSGGGRTALEGSDTLKTLVTHADGRIGVMAAGGITAENVQTILRTTSVRELHAGSAAWKQLDAPHAGIFAAPRFVVDATKVQHLVSAVTRNME